MSREEKVDIDTVRRDEARGSGIRGTAVAEGTGGSRVRGLRGKGPDWDRPTPQRTIDVPIGETPSNLPGIATR